MIAALLAYFFLGGSVDGTAGGSILTTAGIEQTNDRVAVIIEDSDRSGAAQNTLKELGDEIGKFQGIFEKSGKELTESYQDYTTDREQVLKILADLNTSWEGSQQRALDLRFELRDSMTEAEWSKLFGDNR